MGFLKRLFGGKSARRAMFEAVCDRVGGDYDGWVAAVAPDQA